MRLQGESDDGGAVHGRVGDVEAEGAEVCEVPGALCEDGVDEEGVVCECVGGWGQALCGVEFDERLGDGECVLAGPSGVGLHVSEGGLGEACDGDGFVDEDVELHGLCGECDFGVELGVLVDAGLVAWCGGSGHGAEVAGEGSLIALWAFGGFVDGASCGAVDLDLRRRDGAEWAEEHRGVGVVAWISGRDEGLVAIGLGGAGVVVGVLAEEWPACGVSESTEVDDAADEGEVDVCRVGGVWCDGDGGGSCACLDAPDARVSAEGESSCVFEGFAESIALGVEHEGEGGAVAGVELDGVVVGFGGVVGGVDEGGGDSAVFEGGDEDAQAFAAGEVLHGGVEVGLEGLGDFPGEVSGDVEVSGDLLRLGGIAACGEERGAERALEVDESEIELLMSRSCGLHGGKAMVYGVALTSVSKTGDVCTNSVDWGAACRYSGRRRPVGRWET